MRRPGCSAASCPHRSAPAMNQRGEEWLCSSSLHRANNTYALTQSSTFSRLREEPTDAVTLHTNKGKSHRILLFFGPFEGFWKHKKGFIWCFTQKYGTTAGMNKPELRGEQTTVTHKYKNQYMGGEEAEFSFHSWWFDLSLGQTP